MKHFLLHPALALFVGFLFGCLTMGLSGCDRLRPVKRYQQKATEDCEKHHTAEQCAPLPYPSQEPR